MSEIHGMIQLKLRTSNVLYERHKTTPAVKLL